MPVNYYKKTYRERETTPFLLYLTRGISRFEKLGESVFLPKKHVLIEPGQPTQYCYVVKKGRVVSFEIFPNGEERIYHFHEQDSLFLENNLLFGTPTSVGFKTDCATELIRINKFSLVNAINEDPQLALDIIESTSTKYQASIEQMRHSKNYSITWKICDLLLSFAEHYGIILDNKIIIKEKLSQQVISNMLGVNRITTVRAIKVLKELGLIGVISGYYCIYDLDALVEYQFTLSKFE